ncbi:MAG: helix-turn-helix domain-containing protein [Elusimicrobiota bacterium]|nr:MAG: helix-turn-helix domain-containing protein [Elusimicrobiota bacterium]
MPRLTRVPLPQRQALNQVVALLRDPPSSMTHPPAYYLRALRAILRMSQRQLAIRSGVEQAEICRIERGRIDPQYETLKKLFDGLFCDILVLPRPRKRPGDALAEVETHPHFDWVERSPWKPKNYRMKP